MDLSQKLEVFDPAEDLRWLGKSHGFDEMDSITLDPALFDLVTDFPNGYIPSGVALGKVTATGKYAPYTDAGTHGAGTETCAGFLGTTQKFDADSGDNISAPLFWHGEVIEANLPTGHGVTAAAKADLKHIKFV